MLSYVNPIKCEIVWFHGHFMHDTTLCQKKVMTNCCGTPLQIDQHGAYQPCEMPKQGMTLIFPTIVPPSGG
jgi:hypothetical protein